MKNKTIIQFLAVLIATMMGIPSGRADLSSGGRRLESQYEKQLESLKKELEAVVKIPEESKKSDYFKARDAEAAAFGRLEEARERVNKYGQAKGLVKHAKDTWIGGAEKEITKAKEQLKKAQGSDERKAAEENLAKCEKNKEEGLKALEERQALLDEAEKDKPKAEKALKEAEEALVAAKTRTQETIDALGLNEILTSDTFDGRLAKYVVMMDATPKGLAMIAQEGREEEEIIEAMLSDDDLLVTMAVADGAMEGNYGQAMKIYHDIRKASPRAAEEGTLQRLALAIALEHAKPVKQRSAVADSEAPAHVDPVKRYLQYEKAFLDKRLDPAFANLSVWDMRWVVDGEEPPEISEWGREMLRTYRPDQVTMNDYNWRYVSLVRSDIPYGSQNVKDDKDELQFFQNILMNGGICGRRAFIGRFMLRSFGIPTIARPQKGHAALAHWTPKGWVICLGAGWGKGWTKTVYTDDLDFLATTQARSTGVHYLQVKRAHWIADLMGEKRVWGLRAKAKPEFWNGVALYTQRALIEAADAKTLEAVGEDIAEASDTKEKIEIADVEITDEDRKIRVEDGVIRIPAAATSDPKGNGKGILFMDSNLGGKQLHYERGKSPEFEYVFQAPDDGKYALFTRVATPSWKLVFEVAVNGDDVVQVPLPHTVGLWDLSEPVAVELKKGRNVLRFKRQSGSNDKGISIKEFKLVPWEQRQTVAAEEEQKQKSQAEVGDDQAISPSYRSLLAASLLRDLAKLSAENKLQPLPMELSMTDSKVQLLEAKGNGILAIQAMDGGKVVPVALEDLALEDQGLLARLAARLNPEDASANALAAVYMEALGNDSVAADYKRKAGPEAFGQFVASHDGLGE